jgi:two-component system, chemotaxis family, chemotaxis protein CheY
LKTVLIVDDSRTTRNFHAAVIAAGGFHVLTASDGMEGLERLFASPCDIVLTDINMDGMDGYEFIRRIRSSPDHQDLPIVIISTEGDEVDKVKGFAAGANLYLIKPSSPDVILRYVRMMTGAPNVS